MQTNAGEMSFRRVLFFSCIFSFLHLVSVWDLPFGKVRPLTSFGMEEKWHAPDPDPYMAHSIL